MLEVPNIVKHFGGVRAVDGVSFTVAGNEIHGLIGPNGGGKTTMLNLISGLLTPSQGEILVDGHHIENLPAESRARTGLARTFQNLRLFKNLSVRQNIKVAEIPLAGRSAVDPDLVEDAIDLFHLRNVLEDSPDSLLYGQMRRLEIVRALALQPKETTELLDNLIWLRKRRPCAIIIIDHDLKFIMSACEKLTVMNMGCLLASGLPENVTNNREVINAYLGQAN